jgi:Transglutaminase-like superfamily
MRIPRAREIPIVFRSGVLAALVPVMVKAFPLPRVLALLQPRKKRIRSSWSPGELARIADAVVKRGPRFGVGECLVRSLVLYNLLRRSAYDAVLLIGARLCADEFDGHCWIEVDGKTVHEHDDPGNIFKIFYRFGL